MFTRRECVRSKSEMLTSTSHNRRCARHDSMSHYNAFMSTTSQMNCSRFSTYNASLGHLSESQNKHGERRQGGPGNGPESLLENQAELVLACLVTTTILRRLPIYLVS